MDLSWLSYGSNDWWRLQDCHPKIEQNPKMQSMSPGKAAIESENGSEAIIEQPANSVTTETWGTLDEVSRSIFTQFLAAGQSTVTAESNAKRFDRELRQKRIRNKNT